jgi:hypothetical protein
MLRLTLIFAIVGMLLQTGFTQDFDKRLLEKYTIGELKTMKKNTPDELKFITFCLENAFYTGELPRQKMKDDNGRIGEISIPDYKNINFAELDITLIQDDYQYFHILGTETILVIRSIDHIQKEMSNE